LLRREFKKKQISIEHIGTKSMLADPLTKGLIPKFFYEYIAHLGITVDDNLL